MIQVCSNDMGHVLALSKGDNSFKWKYIDDMLQDKEEFENCSDYKYFTQDENSPFNQLKHFWMSTECSRNVH